MTRTCCAHGCKSSTKKNPGLKFFDLSQAKGSLAEWLAAFPRRYRVDIVADVTAGNTDAYSICEEHFSDSQRCQTPNPDMQKKIFNSDKSSQTENSYSLTKLMVSPVEIVDIQPDTNHFPEFVAVSNMQPIDNINIGAYRGLTYSTKSPQYQTNIVALPEFVSNISSIQPRSENKQLPAFSQTNNALLPAVQSSSTLTKTQMKGCATKKLLKPVRIRPKTKPRNSKIAELITNTNVSSPNLQPMNVVDIPGTPATTSFIQPTVDSVDPILFEITNDIQPSSNTNNSLTVDNVPCDVSIKIEEVDDRTMQNQQGAELQSENVPEEHTSDIIQIDFTTTDDSYTISQEDGNIEDYVKFEVDKSKEGNIETYCFFEDDSAKRRKVETVTTESNFRIVKVEIHPDQNDM